MPGSGATQHWAPFPPYRQKKQGRGDGGAPHFILESTMLVEQGNWRLITDH
jgi:hypothetical protein